MSIGYAFLSTFGIDIKKAINASFFMLIFFSPNHLKIMQRFLPLQPEALRIWHVHECLCERKKIIKKRRCFLSPSAEASTRLVSIFCDRSG